MGKNTHYFRQTKSSMTGSQSAQAYSQIQRGEPWHKKVWNFIKVRGKGVEYGKS